MKNCLYIIYYDYERNVWKLEKKGSKIQKQICEISYWLYGAWVFITSHTSTAIVNSRYDPHFPLQHQQKDLRLVLGLGDSVEQPLHLAAAANELYKKAKRMGYGEGDMAAVFKAASQFS